MKDNKIERQRVLIVSALAAAVVLAVAFAAVVVTMCANPDLQVWGSDQDQAQKTGRNPGWHSADGETRILSDDELAFVAFLENGIWVDALGESWIEFKNGKLVLHEGMKETHWDCEFVSCEGFSADAFEGAGTINPCSAVLLVDGVERRLTLDPYEPVWSYESGSYDGPVSDCLLMLSSLDRAYYRAFASTLETYVTILPADLTTKVFGNDLHALAVSITTYCKDNLPTVTEVTYTGEFFVDEETGAEFYVFVCKGAEGCYLAAKCEKDGEFTIQAL